MRLYVLTFIAVSVFPLLLAGYGGHLATLALEKDPKARRNALTIVWVLALFGVILFGVTQVVTYRGDKARTKEDGDFRKDVLGKLQHIIEEPDVAQRKVAATSLMASISNAKVIPQSQQ